MKSIVPSLLTAIGLALAAPLEAQVPQYISYQGRMTAAGANVAGPTGQFKFAIMNQNSTTTFWSHDNSSVNGSEPTTYLTLRITDGLFTVLLGDDVPPIPGIVETEQPMQSIRQTIFDHANVRLRIWFRKDASEPTFTLLSPDQKIGAAGYAMMAYNVIQGAIGSSKLAQGSVTADKLAPDAINALTGSLPPSLDLGAAGVCGLLDLFSTDLGGPGLTLNGCQSEISAFIQTNGVEAVELKAYDYGGLLTLRDPHSRMTLQAGSSGTGGFAQWFNEGGRLTAYVDGSSTAALAGVGNGYFRVAETNGNSRVELLGIGTGGVIQARNGANTRTVWIDANSPINGGGEVSVANNNGSTRVLVDGQGLNGGGEIVVNSAAGRTAIQMIGAESATQGGTIYLSQGNGVRSVEIDGERGANAGGGIYVANGTGTNTIILFGQQGAANGGDIRLYKGNGEQTIDIDADWDNSGKSRIITDVLEIKGGSDLSENFDIEAIHNELKAGLIVCIDPAHPGSLVTSSKPYDRTVAGIVSGAGGVRPGMLMGQQGSAANGKHPVALTGRVYCWVDADQGAIQPGDLITTSDTPGHGMKATDPTRSHGAIIGKAMTGLASGQGMVLVLVSLQ